MLLAYTAAGGEEIPGMEEAAADFDLSLDAEFEQAGHVNGQLMAIREALGVG